MYVTLGRHHWEEGSVSSSPRSPCAPLQPVTPCPGHPDLLLSRHACSFWNHTCSPPSSRAWIPSHRPRVASEIQHVVALLLGVARLQPIVRACHAVFSFARGGTCGFFQSVGSENKAAAEVQDLCPRLPVVTFDLP